jgi:hypothetical protein
MVSVPTETASCSGVSRAVREIAIKDGDVEQIRDRTA